MTQEEVKALLILLGFDDVTSKYFGSVWCMANGSSYVTAEHDNTYSRQMKNIPYVADITWEELLVLLQERI